MRMNLDNQQIITGEMGTNKMASMGERPKSDDATLPHLLLDRTNFPLLRGTHLNDRKNKNAICWVMLFLYYDAKTVPLFWPLQEFFLLHILPSLPLQPFNANNASSFPSFTGI
jgi:hypothetical protein